ncbi:MAG: hypothetical protein N5P05_002630 [Chroococcopsis gigantea SAG 12.99]|jgi:steroid delta-isomerase-like uncharacterized protein|nr:hypothetical protein [Chroococcopsis gigantea SAG 12.99]
MKVSSSPDKIVLGFYEAFDKGELDRATALLAPDFVAHVAGSSEPLDRESFADFGLKFSQAFPDGQHIFNQVLVDGNRVVTEGKFVGTHTGSFQGLPPTGKKVQFSLMHIDLVEDGLIVEHWGQGDQLGLIQQLGILTIPGPTLVWKFLVAALLNPLKIVSVKDR